MTQSLVEAVDRALALDEQVQGFIERGEPIPVELSKALDDSLDVKRGRAEAAGRVLVRLKVMAESCANEAEALQMRTVRLLARRARLEAYVKAVMEGAGLQKVEGDTVTMTLLPGRERVELDDELFWRGDMKGLVRVIPERVEPDKQAIRKMLLAGKHVSGARLERGESSLRVYI